MSNNLVVTTTPSSRHSEDGAWWWDGHGWLPAWTSDRRFWFDGHAWQDRRSFLSVRAKAFVVAWLVTLFAIFVVAWALAGAGSEDGTTWLVALAIPSGLSLLTGIVAGYVLGRERLSRFVPRVALVASGVLLGGYVASFLFVSGDANSDNEAGAGLAFFLIPTVAAMFLVLGLGWLPGDIVARRRAGLAPER